MNLRTLVGAVVLAVCLRAAPRPRASSNPAAPPQLPPLPDAAAISAPQIQRWFEAFTVIQAQEALESVRSAVRPVRHPAQSAAGVAAKAPAGAQPDHGRPAQAHQSARPAPTTRRQLADRLKALRDEDERGAAELRRRYEAVDETLDVRQQARFRIFEERMEQQKLELLMRARQNARNAARGRATVQSVQQVNLPRRRGCSCRFSIAAHVHLHLCDARRRGVCGASLRPGEVHEAGRDALSGKLLADPEERRRPRARGRRRARRRSPTPRSTRT